MRNALVLALAVLCGLAFVSRVQAQCPPDQLILNGASLGNGVEVGLNTSGGRTDWLSNDGTSFIMRYPASQAWGAVFFTFGPAGSRQGRDISGCSALVLEMSGDAGSVEVGIKDAQQRDDGTETKVPVQITGEWQTYAFPLTRFVGADLKRIYLPAEIVFGGSQAQTVRVRSIKLVAGTGGGAQLLPQFAFGGGWYSALYFANTTDQQISLQIQFIGDDGRPLSVPGLGASTTVALSPRGTAIVEAPDSGPLAQGYVSLSIPQGITGYGVFRQRVSGRSDQEAVVPLSDAQARTSTLIWDDVSSTTAVAIVNPTNTSTVVSVTARTSSGATIGTSSVPLAPGTKTAVTLRSLPGLGGVAGNRGSAEFSVSSGAVAVLGLRFSGEAFTSIPTLGR
jgi:hypothetical protein